MPVTKIKIAFEKVYVTNSADIWGDGEWHFTAKIDGKPVGNPKTEFVAKEGKSILLPDADWSLEVDVSGKKPGDKVLAEFSGIDVDVFSDDKLGAVKAEFRYPFNKNQSIPLVSPVIKGWLFFPDHQYYKLTVTMKVLEEKATATLTGPGSVAISRQVDGSTTFSTVAGPLTPRVEVCPVVPTPGPPSALPGRPPLPPALAAGKDTADGQPTVLFPIPASLNAMANPSVIPALAKTDPDLQKLAARLAVTYVAPGDLDTSYLRWKLKSGPAEFVGSAEGPVVLVRGTSGAAADAMAEFEVRWGSDSGTLMAIYRAWVGAVKTAYYRVNIIMGSKASKSPVPMISAQSIDNQLKMARLIYWQVGIDLKPDSNKTTYDGATTVDDGGNPLPDGIFMVKAAKDNWTTNVDIDHPSMASHLNFRPGVLNIAYIRFTPSDRAAAQDILGVAKKPADEKLSGTPSNSWVFPSGIALDPLVTKEVKMKVFERERQNSLDATYVKHRKKTDPGFTAADLERLYSVVVPASWTGGGGGDSPDRGVNVAHEIGHALGLMHRGSGGHDDGKLGVSDDAVTSQKKVGTKTKKYGHPWNENVMSYGYLNGGNPLALDLDLLQAAVVRRHPAVT